MFAYVAAGLFAVAIVLSVAAVRFGPITPSVVVAAGLLCLSLHVAGVRRGAREVQSSRR
jgi:hypothetical protein